MLPISEGDAIYFTFAGLHKYDLNSGKLLWGVPYDVTEGKLKRANAQAVIDGDVVYSCQGTASRHRQERGNGKVDVGRLRRRCCRKQWALKKPLGVAAIDQSNGQMIWKYDGASDGITNLAFVDDGKTILIADGKNIIGLDTSAQGKVKETYKL